jgi:hypothetical protein
MMGLLVFFALAIPVAIHLISRSQGKVLPFPFLGLLPQQVAATELHIKLRQKRLLVVRLLLIFFACLLVTLSLLNDWWMESEWRSLLNSGIPAPTVVITQDWLLTSNEEDKQALEEQLRSEEFEQVKKVLFVTNNTGTQRVNSVSTQQFIERIVSFTTADMSLSGNDTTTSISNVWSTAQAIATNIAPNSVLHIYTSKRYAQFWGAPTHVRQPAIWHVSTGTKDSEDLSQNLDKESFRIAVIGLEQTSLSPAQIQRMANTEIAIQSLTRAFPAIETVKMLNKNVGSLDSLAMEYDALIIDSIGEKETIASDNLIQLSTLPNSSQPDFVFALGKEIFRRKQQEYIFLNALLSPEQIEDGAKLQMPQTISSLAKKHKLPWESFIAIVLLLLFLIERFMSEQQDNARVNESLDKQSP